MLLEKLLEIFLGHADVNVVIDLNGHARAVAFSDAEAAGEDHLILQPVRGNGIPEQIHDILRALEMAGASDTNLNDQHGSQLPQDFLVEKVRSGVGRNRMEGIIHAHAHALLAISHAEGAAKLHLVRNVVAGDQALQLFNDLTRALDVTGASDTYSDFDHDFVPLFS